MILRIISIPKVIALITIAMEYTGQEESKSGNSVYVVLYDMFQI